MMKKLALVLSFALAATALFAASGFAATTIKIGHVLNTDHSWHKNLAGFANDVKKETEGRVTIQLYPSGQLGNEKDMVEGLTFGTVDGGLIGGGSFQSIDPKFGIEALPYAWPTHEAAYKAFDGKLGKYLFDLLGKKGIVGLAWWENGFRHITNNKKPVVKPEDLKGLKLRVTPDKMRLDTFKLLGAAPMAINFGELYSALQQGVVDGQENPYAIIYSNAFNEVQKYLSKSGHIWGSAVLCVNSDVWNKLSAKDKETVRKLAQKWCAAQRKETIKEENEFLDKLKAKGMKVNDVDKAAFQKAVQPVWKSYESTFGKELMDMVHEYGK
ncbi:DctP family TRAP transporter solute-binding subunit [Cloacibacillus evryensis]|uniref:TRAP transporter substrate-binding protein n=1 Tax=Cloacibacillus evryensis TaxID=508460 RepID=UPI000240D79C|nr:DctP family TRAP transporter solute-binding subunit [Cloacibacillus evryensis]EHL70820.1 DctP family TRAP transporter solute receptor [Synergistes sp. 3_1_syn1]EXG78168.1 tripartite ATP-independent periplasmic transporter solute receptor, DctP family [Cloacibacillus evryensis DSM 19522]MEA5035598.1 DctP family TRAP transporter solute-binding subunit [Cloacibacillus evryensis]